MDSASVRVFSPAHEVGAGDIVITMSGRASVLHFWTLSLKQLA